MKTTTNSTLFQVARSNAPQTRGPAAGVFSYIGHRIYRLWDPCTGTKGALEGMAYCHRGNVDCNELYEEMGARTCEDSSLIDS